MAGILKIVAEVWFNGITIDPKLGENIGGATGNIVKEIYSTFI